MAAACPSAHADKVIVVHNLNTTGMPAGVGLRLQAATTSLYVLHVEFCQTPPSQRQLYVL